MHFLREERRRLGEPESPFDPMAEQPWLDPVLIARLTLYAWPGNVRELRNVARELTIDARGAERLAVSPRLDSTPPLVAR